MQSLKSTFFCSRGVTMPWCSWLWCCLPLNRRCLFINVGWWQDLNLSVSQLFVGAIALVEHSLVTCQKEL